MVEINRRLRQRFRIGGALTVSGFGMESTGGNWGLLSDAQCTSASELEPERVGAGEMHLGQRTGTTTATETATATATADMEEGKIHLTRRIRKSYFQRRWTCLGLWERVALEF